MNKQLLIVLTATATAQFAQAAISMPIFKSGFTNVAGELTNGMYAAVLVDTGDDGFRPGAYDPFDVTLSGQFLTIGGLPTDDWFVFGNGGIAETVFAPPLGADGSIGAINNVSYDELGEGMDFGILWFPENMAIAGSPYGFAKDGNFIIPIDGGVSAEPGADFDPGDASFIIPEPAAGVLAGVLVLLAARRRK